MSAYAWPETTKLPRPTFSLNDKVVGNVIRTQMDSGRFRQRKRWTAALRTISVEWSFTDAQFALFQGVYKYKISDGADWFTMQMPFGNGLNTYTVRFTDNGFSDSYQVGMFHKVTATLETEDDISILSSAAVDAALA
jgi:hypothetical protein